MVLGPDLGLVQHLGARGAGGLDERPYGGAVGREEREVGLAEAVAGLLAPDPERGRRRDAVADGVAVPP